MLTSIGLALLISGTGKDGQFRRTVDLSDGAKHAVEASNDLGRDVLVSLMGEKPGENMVVASGALHHLLSLAWAGATGVAKDQLGKRTGMTGLDHEQAQQILSEIKLFPPNTSERRPTYEAHTGASLWLDDRFKIRPEAESLYRDVFDAPATTVDLQSATGVDRINSWIEEATSGRIPGMLTPQMDVNLILVSTLFIKASWLERFRVDDAKLPFHNGSDRHVTSISYKGSNRFVSGKNFTAARHWLAGRLSIEIYLPHEGVDPKDVIPHIEGSLKMEKESAESLLRFPVWSDDVKAPLNQTLKSIGLDAMFRLWSTWVPASGPALYVSDVRGAVSIDVNENGLEAAAAYSMMANTMGLHRVGDVIQEFIVDRPFAYCVRKTDTGQIILLGVVYEPTA